MASLFATCPVKAIEQVEIKIGELESTQGRIKDLNASIDITSNDRFSFLFNAASLSLPPPYNGIRAIKLSCPVITANLAYTFCKHGKLTLTIPNSTQLSLPFQLQQANDNRSGELKITAIPFTQEDSQVELTWKNKQRTANAAIIDLSLKPLTELFKSFDLSLDNGLVSLTGNISSMLTNQYTTAIQLSGKSVSLQTDDATKAIDKININSNIQANTQQSISQGNFDFHLDKGEIYLEPVYLSLKDSSISGKSTFLLETKNKKLQLSNFTLSHFPTVSLTGSLMTTLEKPFPPDQGKINVQVYNLANLFNDFIAPYLSSTSEKPVISNTQGLILSELEYSDKKLTYLKLSTADVSATYAQIDKNITINNARISLNWRPDHCNEQSFVYWKNAEFSGIPLPETVLRFKACGQQINFERNVTLPLLDGEMQFDHLDLKQLDNGTIDFSFATQINNISLTALSKAFNLPPLVGYLSASIPSVRLEKGGLRLDSSIHVDVFGGKIEIKDLQIDGMLGSYPILTADILFEKLDLGKLSKRFSFGNIEGKLNGTIKGLRIENQKVIAFDAAFSTPKNRFLPYSISQKAVQNIASLGGSSPADLLSRGVLKLFESFFYSRLGFSCKLRDNVCELKGIAPAENKGFYLIKGTLAPQINVIGYEQRVNWSELATRLKRITAQSSPVVQ